MSGYYLNPRKINGYAAASATLTIGGVELPFVSLTYGDETFRGRGFVPYGKKRKRKARTK